MNNVSAVTLQVTVMLISKSLNWWAQPMDKWVFCMSTEWLLKAYMEISQVCFQKYNNFK